MQTLLVVLVEHASLPFGPTARDVLCHLTLSAFLRLLPTRLDERFLAPRRGPRWACIALREG